MDQYNTIKTICLFIVLVVSIISFYSTKKILKRNKKLADPNYPITPNSTFIKICDDIYIPDAFIKKRLPISRHRNSQINNNIHILFEPIDVPDEFICHNIGKDFFKNENAPSPLLIGSDLSKLYIKWANYYFKSGKIVETLKQIDYAIQSSPSKPFLYKLKADVLNYMNEPYRTSILYYSIAEYMGLNSPQLYFNRSCTYLFCHNLSKAHIDILKAIKLSPNKSSKYLINKGYILARKGKLLESLNEFKLALIINMNSASAHFNMGSVFAYIDDNYKAIEAFNQYQELYKNNMKHSSFNNFNFLYADRKIKELEKKLYG